MATPFIAGYTISRNSTVAMRPNIQASMSVSGTLRFMDLGAQTYSIISAEIDLITEAEKETLIDWIETNQTTEVALDVGTETYNGYFDPFAGFIASLSTNSSHLWRVRFQFQGVKQ